MDLHQDVPGATPLTPDDVEGLKLRGLGTREQLYAAEFENITEAAAKYLLRRPSPRRAPFTRAWMVRLHREAFGRVWKWAGQYRRIDTNIGSPHTQIEVAMEDLARDIAFWRSAAGADRAEDGVQLHFRAVWIHPFRNGNGRWARLLANIWLYQNGLPPVQWPEAQLTPGTSVIRSEYIDAIQRAARGDFAPLRELHRRYGERDGASR